jgi:hypothetical protein
MASAVLGDALGEGRAQVVAAVGHRVRALDPSQIEGRTGVEPRG